MRRRTFLCQGAAAATHLGWAGLMDLAASLSAAAVMPPRLGNGPVPVDRALRMEAKYPLLAGDFQQALHVLLPAIRSRQDGSVAYVVATIYFRLEQYATGIPYALQACRMAPGNVLHRWMLYVLTVAAGRSPATIPPAFRLPIPRVHPSPVRFVDVTAEAGVGRLGLGRGAAWADFDGDGREDILAAAERGPFCLFQQRASGRFADIAPRVGLTDPVGLGAYTAQFIDYDNDGWPDIFLAGNGWGGTNRMFLFHNDRGRSVADVTAARGLAEPINAFNCAWADFDADGFSDLAVATGIAGPGDRLRLFHNQGGRRFDEIGREAGLTAVARWISVAWGDYDGDGRPDLCATSYDQGVFLFRNLGGGRFADVTAETGLRDPAVHAYTAEFFDYDNDGRLDLFVSTYPNGSELEMVNSLLGRQPVAPRQWQRLYHNGGHGRFRQVEGSAGITGWYGAMASQVADVDNDGFQDVVLGTGNPELDWAEPKALLRNDGRGRFHDIAAAGLVHFGMLHGMAFADYDRSGRMSLFGNFGGFYWGTRETCRLYRNAGPSGHAVELRLVGRRSNRDAIGARVFALAGGQPVFRWVSGGSGFGSGNSRLVHLGLGAAQSAEHIEITWPAGGRQYLGPVAAGERLEVQEADAAPQAPTPSHRRLAAHP